MNKETCKDLIFFWVPKNAGTSFIRNFNIYTKYPEWDEMKGIHVNKGWSAYGHYHIPTLIDNEVIDKDYYNRAFKMAIKRNPYDRAVSLWRFHWSNISFIQFLNYINKNGFIKPGLFNADTERWSMCSNQIEWLTDDIDLIIPFEELDEYINKIFNKGIMHANKTVTRHTTSYREFYDDEAKGLVEKLYKPDFDRYPEYEF